MQQLKNEQVMLDVQAAINRLTVAGKVGVRRLLLGRHHGLPGRGAA